MAILIASHNPGKFKEISQILQPMGVPMLSLLDLGIREEFQENEESFEANALGKARFYAQKTGLPTFADDSGIVVTALQGELGVKTRRWGAGAKASDEEWLGFFLARMEAEEDRSACFVAAAAYCEGNREYVQRGEVWGKLTKELQAPLVAGIPLSSVFIPEGYDKVYTALLMEGKKHEISHRGQAFQKLLNQLLDA